MNGWMLFSLPVCRGCSRNCHENCQCKSQAGLHFKSIYENNCELKAYIYNAVKNYENIRADSVSQVVTPALRVKETCLLHDG